MSRRYKNGTGPAGGRGRDSRAKTELFHCDPEGGNNKGRLMNRRWGAASGIRGGDSVGGSGRGSAGGNGGGGFARATLMSGAIDILRANASSK